MLKIISSMKELNFAQLMRVYEQSNRENGKIRFPYMTVQEQLLQAEQGFYSYLRESFFSEPGAFYAVWEIKGRYVSALRLEPYQDGLLLEALETAQEDRGKGYATALVGAVTARLNERGSVRVYSHVGKRNVASLAVHRACGFEKILNHAVYVDGSVSHTSYTLCWQTE